MLPVLLGDPDRSLEILCIGAHSDDIEIGCGGTLLRLLGERSACTVHWVVLSSTPEREREARASAGAFLSGAKASSVAVHTFRESYFPYIGREVKECFDELKRAVQPDVVFAHHRRDEHQDHRTVAELTWNSFRNHLVLEYEIPKYEGDLGHPNLYVPLDEAVVERKIELLHTHFASQRDKQWFRADTFRGLMALRGVEANVAFAEAFHVRKFVI